MRRFAGAVFIAELILSFVSLLCHARFIFVPSFRRDVPVLSRLPSVKLHQQMLK
jgi:hypothetical protein